MSGVEFDFGELKAVFLAESEEQLAAAEMALVELERQPGRTELVHEVFRAAHTIKGNALGMGYTPIGELAHAFEDLLDRVRSGAVVLAADTTSLVLRCVDALRTMLFSLARGEDVVGDPALAAALLAVGATTAAPRATTAPPAAAAPAPAAEPHAPDHADGHSHRRLRVSLDRLDHLLAVAGEMGIALGRARDAAGRARPDPDEVAAALEFAEGLHRDLQDTVLQSRLVALGPVLRQFGRTARDVAVAHGKAVHFVVEDHEVEVDARTVDEIRDPLTHLLRNAIDHGLEPGPQRLAAGKAEVGEVALRAGYDLGQIVIEVQDDGRGLDLARIRARGIERGLLPAGADPGPAALKRLLFEPGFSTATVVSDLSGRGVGLDVVKRGLDGLRGSIEVDSSPGHGTTFRLRLPLTMAIVPSLAVRAGGETLLVPLEAVCEVAALPAERSEDGDGHGVVSLRGTPLPFVRLRQRMALGEAEDRTRESFVVVQHGGLRAALVVDELLGESQVVVKPLGSLFEGLTGVFGSAILPSGRVAVILDVPTLLRELVTRADAAA